MLEKLTLAEAAKVLGISPDAVRMRIRRGSMNGEKDDEGRWWVWVDKEEAEAERADEQANEHPGEREPEPDAVDVAELRTQLTVLQARLEAAEGERDHLRGVVNSLLAAQERRDMLALGQTQAQQRVLESSEKPRGWWAKLFGK